MKSKLENGKIIKNAFKNMILKLGIYFILNNSPYSDLNLFLDVKILETREIMTLFKLKIS